MAKEETKSTDANEQLVNHPEPGTKVNTRDKVWLIGTGKNAHLPKGKRFHAHPVQAVYFVERGYATEDKGKK